MPNQELRDGDQARRFILDGLWLQRVAPTSASTATSTLRWALEMASAGQPLPPLGFIADLGHVALAQDQMPRTARDALGEAGLAAGLARSYEDHVLGKLYADWHFERAGDALRRYQGRDQDRGLAFMVNQCRERAGFPGVWLSPAVIRGLRETDPEEVLARGWKSLTQDGLMPLLPQLYEGLIAAARRTGDVLGNEDVFELEHGTALVDMGQRVALRQLLLAAERLDAALPRHKVRPLAGRQEVPTRVLDEDTTRGTIESLLQSQLAYMEKDRPDLFDIKYLRDELLYYARDENQFLRRRRTFIFAMPADLAAARFKDAELPWQRIVLLLGLMLTAVRRLSEWLSTDALLFEFLFLDQADDSLADERKLLEMVLREQIANGTVRLGKLPGMEPLAQHCARTARRSVCHCLLLSTEKHPGYRADDTVVSQLEIAGPCPVLDITSDTPGAMEPETPLDSWSAALERLLQLWV
jgi:hypothetical protein